ncbi:hypothetical protein SAMN00120144_3930 [Hymenobacter roseosalivarius DSM 11622]|uniref:Uncharacterized protein n=1 Tax=Hymenobacter roseosalivarius DSM 11622 TaxID=645990 RepID=A0A1W1VZX1_9BACT|nr:hypothetical protein SAMN00120144_3930 [Hymenobacter roseosalivarius DSM 11622]
MYTYTVGIRHSCSLLFLLLLTQAVDPQQPFPYMLLGATGGAG